MKEIDIVIDRQEDERFNIIKESIDKMTDYGIETYGSRIQNLLYNRVQSLIKKKKEALEEMKKDLENLENMSIKIEDRQLTIEK